jgi:mucin-19
VTPANLTVSASNQSTTYGSLLVLPQNGLTTTGLKNGDYVASATILYNGNQVVPGTVNVGSYAAALAISSASGVGLSNYVMSYNPGTLAVNKALLTVTAVADAKFVSQTDLQGSATNCGGTTCAAGYAGAMISGFQNSDSVASGALGVTPLVIERTNFGTNTLGAFTGVLMPRGLTPQNYNVQYVAGDYVIVPAQQLLVKMDSNTTAYGTAPPMVRSRPLT